MAPRLSEEDYQAILARTRKASERSICDAMAHPLRRGPRQRPEDAMQRAVCDYWQAKYPQTWPMTFHVPNGIPALSPKVAAIFKGFGVKPGVFDILCIARLGPFNGFALELKSAFGSMSDDQNAWQRYFLAEGWFTALGFTLNTALAAVDQYHQLPPTTRTPPPCTR